MNFSYILNIPTYLLILIIKMNPCARLVSVTIHITRVMDYFLLYLSINIVRSIKIKDNSINEYFNSNNNGNSY